MPALATGAVFLVVSAFLASTVEMVEALTIVLAVSAVWLLVPVGVVLILAISLRRAIGHTAGG